MTDQVTTHAPPQAADAAAWQASKADAAPAPVRLTADTSSTGEPQGTIRAADSATGTHVGKVAWSLDAAKNTAEVSDLEVAPAYRRQGIAGQLMDAAIERGRTTGAEAVQLGMRPEDQHTSLSTLERLYSGKGFRRQPQKMDGAPLMRRPL